MVLWGILVWPHAKTSWRLEASSYIKYWIQSSQLSVAQELSQPNS